MKTIETLFDTAVVKEKRQRHPVSILQTKLKQLANKDGMYHYKIVFNRVWFNKVKHFHKGLDKTVWVETARRIADEKWGNLIVLVDKKKANQ
jgi:hypothetical protein